MRNRPSLDVISGPAFRWFVLIGAPILLAMLGITKNFPGLADRAATDVAQVARNLAETGHFATQSIRPLSLLLKPAAEGHPDLYNEPLQPLLLSVAFRLIKASDKVVAGTGAVLWLALLWLTIAFTKRVFSWRLAMLAGLLLATNTFVLRWSVTGTTAMLAALLVALLLWVLYRQEPEATGEAQPADGGLPTRQVALAGALLGLCALTSYRLAVLAIPVAVYVWLDQRPARLKRVGLLIGVALAVTSPWLLRNTVVLGNPFGTLQMYDVAAGTPTYPGDSLFRSMDPATVSEASPARFLWTHPGQVLDKLRSTVLGIREPAMESLGQTGVVAAFLLFGMFYGLADGGFVRLRRCYYGMFVSYLVVAGVTRSRAADLIIFVPFATLIAAAAMRQAVGAVDVTSFRRAWQVREWRVASATAGRLAVLTVLVLIALWPFSIWLRQGSTASVAAAMPKLEYLRAEQGAKAPLVVSDQPEAVAWYSRRTTVWLPKTSTGYDRIVQNVGPVGVLHFWDPPMALAQREGATWWATAYASPGAYKGLVQDGPGGVNPAEKIRVPPDKISRDEGEARRGAST